MTSRLRVLHLTAELWPFAQTGGLGQAVAGLARYQAGMGIDTTVLLPLYREARERAGELEPFGAPFVVDSGGAREELRCWREVGAAPRKLFLEHQPSFDRPGIYGAPDADYHDNHRRFAVFAMGAVEVARRLHPESLILHAHDWHAALAPVYLRQLLVDRPLLHHLPCIVTVHNGGFQGLFPPHTLAQIGLPERLWTPEFMEWYGRVNFLKGGVLSADFVTTVSRTHAQELRTEVGGFGLDSVFRNLGDRLVGIRNGIDTEAWNPELDPYLPASFTRDDLAGKRECKEALRSAWNLQTGGASPLFAMSARLVSQKGLDLVLVSRAVRDLDAQFVFLGSGEPRYEVALAELAAAFPGRIAVNTAFSDALEHRLLAGADFLLMPSLYEPCGLTQMRAQVYGALPIARRVGGLSDTIDDGRTGILFDGYTPEAFDEAVHRAIELYRQPSLHTEQVRDAMRRDFSWCEPAAAYAGVYRRAYAARASARADMPPTPGRATRRVRELSGATPA